MLFDPECSDWQQVSAAYDLDNGACIHVVLGKMPLIGIHHRGTKSTGLLIDLRGRVRGLSYEQFLQDKLGIVPRLFYLRTAGLEMDAKATRLLVGPPSEGTRHCSVMCDERSQFNDAASLLHSIGFANSLVSSAHGIRTKFAKNRVPIGFLNSERAGTWRSRMFSYGRGDPMILIFIDGGEPGPYEICESLLYHSCNISFKTILFSCARGLNEFQRIVLRYCIENWPVTLDQLSQPALLVN